MSTKRKATSRRSSLTIKVLKARGLAARDASGLSDPYVLLRVGSVQLRTKTIVESLEPVWDETFEIEGVSVDALLRVALYDYDTIELANMNK